MYIPSNKYIEASKKISRNPKSKIIIDDVIYTGRDIIKTYPSFSHDAQKMIGEFPTKECKFVIFNRENNINVVNKDIKVYRGLLLDDNTIEYIPQGVFHALPDGIKTNSTAKTIELTIKDKSNEFDSLYGGMEFITYPTTIGKFIDEIVTRRGFILETTEFPFSDFALEERPNFNLNTTTERMLISAAAALGGCNAQMSRTGGVKINKPHSTGSTIKKINYKSLASKEKRFGPINVVSLGKNGINDDIQFRDEESIAIHGECEWKILDNPFVDLIRQESIDTVANNIIGMQIIPFELKDCIDNYLYDINDSVAIEDKLGNLFVTTILNVSSNGRIYTNLKSDVQISGNTDKNLAGSSKVELKNIKLDVNHVKNEMELVAKEVIENTENIAQIKATVEVVTIKVSEVETSIDEVHNEVETITPVISTSGYNLQLNDSAGKDLISFSVEGKIVQKKRIGKNLFDFSKVSNIITQNGLTITKNGSMFTLSGTTTDDLYRDLSFSTETVSDYYFSGSLGYFKLQYENGYMNQDGSFSSKILRTYLQISKGTTFNNQKFFLQLEKGNVKTDWEQYGVSPSPQFSSEIKNVGRLINFFDGTYELGNLDVNGNIDTSVIYRMASLNFMKVRPNQLYTISNDFYIGNAGRVIIVCEYDKDKKLITRSTPLLNNYKAELTTRSNTRYIKFGTTGVLSEPQNDMNAKVMFSLGREQNDYVSYGNLINISITNKNIASQSQKISIDLKGNTLSSINEICDVLQIDSSVYIDKKINQIELNGTEVIIKHSSIPNLFLVTDPALNCLSENDKIISLCSHAPTIGYSSLVGSKLSCFSCMGGTGNPNRIFFKHDTINDLATFRSWLKDQNDKSNPITIYYQLSETQVIELDEYNIPTKNGDCNIRLVDQLQTNLSCKYYKNSDVTNYFTTKQETSAQIKIASDFINSEVSKTNENLNGLVLETNFVKQEVDKITEKYEKTGGSNKIRDSVGRFNSKEYWINSETGKFIQGYDQNLVGRTESASKISIHNGSKSTTKNNIINLISDKEVFFSYKLTNEENTITIIRLIGNKIIYENIVSEKIDLKEYVFSFIPNTTNLILEIISTTTQQGWSNVSDLMLGDSKLWEQAQNETWSRIIETNEFGQLIRSPQASTAYFTGAEGMAIHELAGAALGKKVGGLDKNGLLTTKVNCTEIVQNGLVNINININSNDNYVRYIKGG